MVDLLKVMRRHRLELIVRELRDHGNVHDLDELLDEPGEGIPGDEIN